jgi:hypothetical protein
MQWYYDLFHDEWAMQYDPEGYRVGLVFGYVIIPLSILILLIAIASRLAATWRWARNRKRTRT